MAGHAGALAVTVGLDDAMGRIEHVFFTDPADAHLRKVMTQVQNMARTPAPHPTGQDVVCFQLHQYTMVEQDVLNDAGDRCGTIIMAFAKSFDATKSEEIAANLAQLLAEHLNLVAATMRAEMDVISETRRADRFRRMSELDQLTRLDNRTTFRQKVEAMIDADAEDFALILIDIDQFKAINDLYGHSFGDRYLKQIAATIKRSFGRATARGRLGGDEFAVLLPLGPKNRLNETQLREMADMEMARFVIDVQRTSARMGRMNLGHVSLGAALGPLQSKQFDRLFDMADAALYSGKTSNSSAPTVFLARDHDSHSFRLLQNRFMRALEKREITPYYQPIVRLSDGEIHGFEALARWEDPDRGVLPPQKFNGIFADPTLAPRLTEQISAEALSWLGRKTRKTPQSIAINLTPFEVLNHEFVFDLEIIMAEVGLDWSSITLEVTESVMLSSANDQSFRTLTEIRSRGGRVALDDFGTGYGAMSHLIDWPVDILKIDRSFVMSLDPTSRRAKIVEGLVRMSRDLGFDIVAEGVDCADAHVFLRDIGCTFGQGYYYSRPLPGAQAARLSPKQWAALSS
ncbi:putative bifunctional diguanylate cyclase/phosphodiesterase [Sagittula sp. SSi028]|uniref:putative bifunctional diguanylate cyclase/phosphodiesterase n=1 Tax=Sagittula sp. SSi028 TaxID=3400636 RepID=UPI003AF90C84